MKGKKVPDPSALPLALLKQYSQGKDRWQPSPMWCPVTIYRIIRFSFSYGFIKLGPMLTIELASSGDREDGSRLVIE